MSDAFGMMLEQDSEKKLMKKLCTQKNVKKTVECLGCQIARNKTISSFDAQDFVNGEYHYFTITHDLSQCSRRG
jgi:hypothetical protein